MKIPAKTPIQRYIIRISDKYYTGTIPLAYNETKTVVRSKEWDKATKYDSLYFWRLPLHIRDKLRDEYSNPKTVVSKVPVFDKLGVGLSEDLSAAKRFNKISSVRTALNHLVARFPNIKIKVQVV